MSAPLYGLTYHDVTPAARRAESGFCGTGAEHYKLTPEQFDLHLRSIGAAGRTPRRVDDVAAGPGAGICLTFDDGGISGVTTIAPLLAGRGWPGHFFITTDRIGQAGFVGEDDIRALAAGGHVVGSHSCSHRLMTRLSDEEIAREWTISKERLEAVIEGPVRCLSVPTGYFSSRVARLAVAAGYRHLFTSEPWLRPRPSGSGCLYGRFSVTAAMPPSRVEALCRGRWWEVTREAAGWNARKAAKVLLGPLYFGLRRSLLERSSRRNS